MVSEGGTNTEGVELLIAHSRARHPEQVDEAMYERWRAEARRHDELVRQADLATIRARLGPDAVAAALDSGRPATPEDVEKVAKRTSSAMTEPRDQALT